MGTKTNYTPSQQAVINQQGNNLLVSASAGSGKTTVLIERIMQKVLAGVNVDQLLVVTFTDLAAKNMKQKMEKRLNQQIATLLANDATATTASPEVRRLRQQLNLLGVANISTIDSFCKRVVQRYYYVIDLDPIFRLLADETEGLLIRDQVWDTVREQLYASDGELFDLLTANFSNDRNDDGLGQLVFRLFDFAQSTPDPEDWLQHLPDTYDLQGKSVTESAFFKDQLLPILKTAVQSAQQQLDQAIEITETNALNPKTLTALQTAKGLLQELMAALPQANWDSLRNLVSTFKVGATTRKYAKEPEKNPAGAKMGALVDAAKKTIKQLKETYFNADEQTVLDIMVGARAIVTELVRATLTFKAAFAQEKRQRQVLDFSDLEHFTLQILTTDTESGRGALNQLRHQFEEVMVDEYQDINSMQERILQLLSRDDPGNLFMVGDVKQSIYQFRLADPTLFLGKYRDYGAHPEHGDRIVLAENFRSVENVDNLTNLIFSQLMDEPVGQIDYDAAAYLKYGPKDYPAEMPQTTSLLLYQTDEPQDEQSTKSKPAATETDQSEQDFSIDDPAVGSITMVAKKIIALKQMAHPIYDRAAGEFRPFRYSDAALLVPTRAKNLSIIDVFKQYHIPIVVNDAQNYFQTTEIRIMMALLSIIDNPYQDIPLVAVLRSPIVGLDENQLVYLRIQNKTSDYFQSVKDFYQNYPGDSQPTPYADRLFEKIKIFMEELRDFRDLARRNQIVTLIWQIYERTGFLDYVGGMPAGAQRQANLHALYERAYTYEQGSFKGVFQFVRFIKRMQEKDKDLASAVAETETEAVSVMTIHGSKGLEFPVVFLMNMDKQFNVSDTRANALLDRQAGIGIQYLDPERRIQYSTLPRLVNQRIVDKKLRAEEMRKLYVAVTRAEQQLFLVGTVKNIEAATKQWRQVFTTDELVLPAAARTSAKSQLDWVGMSLIRHPAMRAYWDDDQPNRSLADNPAKFTVELGDATILAPAQRPHQRESQVNAIERVEAPVDVNVDQLTRDQLHNLLNFHYRFETSAATTAYQSVSEVKRVFEDPDNARMGTNPLVSDDREATTRRFVTDELAMPQFLQTVQAPTSAEVGSATHLVLEQLPLDQPVDAQVVATTIAGLVETGVLTATLAAKIRTEAVVGFYQSDLGRQILADPAKVHREVPFSLLMPAQQLFADLNPDENAKVLIHGIIDGYLETPTGLILFDYKTDHVRHTSDLLNRYAGQVRLYAEALTVMYQQPVTQQLLYSLPHHEFVAVPRN